MDELVPPPYPGFQTVTSKCPSARLLCYESLLKYIPSVPQSCPGAGERYCASPLVFSRGKTHWLSDLGEVWGTSWQIICKPIFGCIRKCTVLVSREFTIRNQASPWFTCTLKGSFKWPSTSKSDFLLLCYTQLATSLNGKGKLPAAETFR